MSWFWTLVASAKATYGPIGGPLIIGLIAFMATMATGMIAFLTHDWVSDLLHDCRVRKITRRQR